MNFNLNNEDPNNQNEEKKKKLMVIVALGLFVVISFAFFIYAGNLRTNSIKHQKDVNEEISMQQKKPSSHKIQKGKIYKKTKGTDNNIKNNKNFNYANNGYKYLFLKNVPEGGNSQGPELPNAAYGNLYQQMLDNGANGLWKANLNIMANPLKKYRFTTDQNKILFGLYLDSKLLASLNNRMTQEQMGKTIKDNIKTPQAYALCTLHASPTILTYFVIDGSNSIAPNSNIQYHNPVLKQYVSIKQKNTLPKLDINFNPLEAIYNAKEHVASVYEIKVPAPEVIKNNSRKTTTALYTYILEHENGKLEYYGMYYQAGAGDVTKDTDERPLGYFTSGEVKQAVDNAKQHQQNDKSGNGQNRNWNDFYRH